MRRFAPVFALAVALIAATTALADLAPICLDGWFDDWAAIAPLATDPAGDGGSTGIDFGELSAANDQDWLFIRFTTGADVQPDEQQDIRIYLDTDMNAATGYSYGGIGAELVWNLGARNGTFYRGGTTSISHPDIGLQVGPTVSSTVFEIALRRDAVPAGGQALFPGDTVRFVLRDGASGGDVTSPVSYTFVAGTLPVESLPLGRANATDIRLASWNLQSDALFDNAAFAAQDRLLQVMDPDILIVCESWNHDAAQTTAKLEEHLPSGPGEQWYGVYLDGGNVLCSRFPILQSWLITPTYRNTAALLDLGPSYDTDLLLIGSHWRCCTADSDRQKEADAVVAFLRDAKTAGGVIDLPVNTPILMAGDLNLVGWRQQLDTIITGDIQNEGTYGADAAPDWDGSPFATPHSRHPDQRSAYSWFADYSSYYPGMLDWMFYTGSVLTLQHNYVLETRTMAPTTRATYGLLEFDTTDASDHAARVADFGLGSPLSAVPAPTPAAARAHLLPNAPNPFNPSTQLRFAVESAGDVSLAVYDARGRLVRDLGTGAYPAGEHAVTWNGRDDRGRAMASGVYFVRLTAGAGAARTTATRPITLLE